MLKEMDHTIVMPDYLFWDIHGIMVGVDTHNPSSCSNIGPPHSDGRHINFTRWFIVIGIQSYEIVRDSPPTLERPTVGPPRPAPMPPRTPR